MKLSSVEKAINKNGYNSWVAVRDVASNIIRKRKSNDGYYVSALGSHPDKGVEIAIQHLEDGELTTIVSVWVKHEETNYTNPTVVLLAKFGYEFV